MTDYTMEDVFDLVILNEEVLRRLAKQILGSALEDHGFSECLQRTPNILDNYDPEKGSSLKTHLISCCRWYLWKEKNRLAKIGAERARERFVGNFIGEYENSYTDTSTANVIFATEILEQLSEQDYALLYWKYVEGFTLQEIADCLGVSKGTARNYVNDALSRAKRVAGVE